MRNRSLLFVCPIVVLLAGCHNTPTPVAAGGTSAASIPVGPIPGGVQDVHYEANPVAGDPVALQDGRRLFNWYNCSGCHGGHGGGGMGPSLRDAVWIYGSRSEQIYDSIAQGRAKGMPAWGSKIPQTQIWELVAYIKSMRSPQEPDPPVEPPNEQTFNPVDDTMYGVGQQTGESGITEPVQPPYNTPQSKSSLVVQTPTPPVKEPGEVPK